MRVTFVALVLTIVFAGCGAEERQAPPEPGAAAPGLVSADPALDLSAVPAEAWRDLFNGRDLEGWIPKIRGEETGKDSRGTFRVVDGAITVSYEEYETFADQFGHLFHQETFGDYFLEVEYRFFGEQLPDGPGWAYRNSGLMLHGQEAGTMGLSQDFPISIEVQLLGGNGVDDRSTANLCTPGTNVEMDGALDTRHCIESSSATYHGDDWVTAGVLVLGDSLMIHYVNGQEVLRYGAPQVGGGNVDGHDAALKVDGSPLRSGSISLQSESHPLQFRRVSLLELAGCTDPNSPAYRAWFIRNVPGACAAPTGTDAG